MEDAYIIQGGKELRGDITLSGAKNVALKVLIAALMVKGDVTLHSIPRIRDVLEEISLIESLGGRVTFIDKNSVVVNGDNLSGDKVDLLFASKIRTSFMFFAPLIAGFGRAHIPNPGGCRLGARSIDRSIEGMQAIGIDITYDSDTGYYHAQMKNRPSGTYRFPKPSHTGTELLLMIATLTKTQVTLQNTALEPEIDDLIGFLTACGANINRKDRDITIRASQRPLKQQQPYSIVSDRIEAVTYAVLALATKGSIFLSPIEKHYIAAFVDVLKKAGITVTQHDTTTWEFQASTLIKAIDLETAPYPGFLTDWQPFLAILMTQAQGTSTIHERIFENRFSYVEELRKLGAHIEYMTMPVENPAEFYHFNYDPTRTYNQAIAIHGPQELHNGVLNVADMRAGATLVTAALCAHGESVVNGVSHIERGYEDLVEKVSRLGGDIRKV